MDDRKLDDKDDGPADEPDQIPDEQPKTDEVKE